MKTKEIVLPENWEVKEVKGNKIILKRDRYEGASEDVGRVRQNC